MPRLLAIIPHPDDEAYSFAATIAAAAADGWEAHIACASAGENGKRYDGGPAGPTALASRRRDELRASCRLLRAHPPLFWDLPDSALREAPSQRDRVLALLRGLKPDLILALGADGAYGHPDHVAVHHWVRSAWESDSRSIPLLLAAFPPGLFGPQWEKCRGMMGEPPVPPLAALGVEPAHYALRSGRFRERKLASIAAHRSQLPAGDPEGLFPAGLVAALLPIERFTDATGAPQETVLGWFERWQALADVSGD